MPSMFPQELIRCGTMIGAGAGAFFTCGAADAEAPQVTEVRITAAAARERRTRMPLLMSGTLRR